MKQAVPFFLFIILLFIVSPAYNQQDTTAIVYHEETEDLTPSSDTLPLKNITQRSPTKAALWAIVPGGGQIYNKKWWKLPIVYSLLGASGGLIYYFGSETIKYRNEYFFRQYKAEEYYNPDLTLTTTESILQSRDNFRRYTEIAIGAFAICYLLSVIDAVVDAHLFYFDISDDLSMQLAPQIFNSGIGYNKGGSQAFSSGLTLKISF